MAMTAFERELLEGVTEVTTEVQLLRVNLLGSQEDGFKAGRLPILEGEVAEMRAELKKFSESKSGKLPVFFRWVGRILVGASGYLIHEFFRNKVR